MTGKSYTSVIVVGAGIAGLVSAIAFARAGIQVTVCERSDQFSEVGAGLQLSPNATSLLDRLGVLESLLKHATVVEAVDLISATSGQTLLSLPTSRTQTQLDMPWLCTHRADLQSVLLNIACGSPLITIRTGLEFQSAQQCAMSVTADFHQKSETISLSADILVGADGTWSKVRSLVQSHATTEFSGYIAWRATLDAHSHLPTPLATLCRDNRVGVFLSANAHLVAYPLRGGKKLNLVLVTRGEDLLHGWDQPPDPIRLNHALESLQNNIALYLKNAPNWRAWPMHQRSGTGAWVTGRIALMGDAAHAMTPFAAQGACMAIEDAYVLAQKVRAKHQDINAALLDYQRQREPRVAKVMSRGQFNRFAYHLPTPFTLARNLVFSLKGSKLMEGLDWLYKYDADAG